MWAMDVKASAPAADAMSVDRLDLGARLL